MSEVLVRGFGVIEQELVDVLFFENFEGFFVTVDNDFLQGIQKEILVSFLLVDQFENHWQVVSDVTLEMSQNISHQVTKAIPPRAMEALYLVSSSLDPKRSIMVSMTFLSEERSISFPSSLKESKLSCWTRDSVELDN